MKRPVNLWLMAIVACCALSFWFGQGGDDDSPRRQQLPAESTAGSFRGDPNQESIHLRILNGTEKSGLAGEFGLLVGRLGCVVEGVGNAPLPDLPRTLLVNRRLPWQRAEKMARRLGDLPLVQEWDPRCTEDLVLVLGADHDALRQALVQIRSVAPGE
jgi:hypothetical protein